jgi:hypothetical protein
MAPEAVRESCYSLFMKARFFSFLIPAIVLAGCSSTMTSPSSSEVWQFTATTPDGTASSATLTCSSVGVCQGGSWTLATNAEAGCVLNVSFTAAFSGTSVALSNFERTADSTCTGPSLPRGDAAGTGSANTIYPNASSAQGSARVPFVGVLYIPGAPQPFPWQAHRIS